MKTTRAALNAGSARAGLVPRTAQLGFTLIELMIAILIGLFLIGGLLTLVGAMKRTSTIQSGLSQLLDNERMTTTLMTDVIQSTGYYPNPTNNTLVSIFPANATFATAGQAIVGSGSWTAAAPGDTITVQYATAGTTIPGSDGIINCSGNTSPIAATFVNTFSVDNFGDLNCNLTINGAAQPTIQLISGQTNSSGVLVNGVTRMQIYYGVQTNAAAGTYSVDTYMDATTLNAAIAGGSSYNWSNVISVMLTLTFVNPLYGQPGQTSPTIVFTRVVDIMAKTGVTT
jgi:type IV pilus assembly protein PilW